MASLVANEDGRSKSTCEDGRSITGDSIPASICKASLFNAAIAGDTSYFQFLSPDELSTALPLRYTYKSSLLHEAAESGHINLVKFFVDRTPGIPVDIQDYAGRAPIHICISSGLLHMVEELIRLGADVKLKTFRGLTPLHVAAQRGKFKEVQLLIKHGADVNAKDRALSTPLHQAAGRQASLEICEYLLKEGAELDAVDQAGQTPLTHAVICQQKEVVLFLIRQGADIGLKKEYIILDRYPADFLDDPSLSLKARDRKIRKQSGIRIRSTTVRLSGYYLFLGCNISVNTTCSMPAIDTNRTADGTTLENANVALSWYNEKRLSGEVKGREYELVKVVSGTMLNRPSIYHCNFIARPKNGSEAHNSLFFAEVKLASGNRVCTVCSITRGTSTKTGLRGCKICVRFPGLIQHPRRKNGFTKWLPE